MNRNVKNCAVALFIGLLKSARNQSLNDDRPSFFHFENYFFKYAVHLFVVSRMSAQCIKI